MKRKILLCSILLLISAVPPVASGQESNPLRVGASVRSAEFDDFVGVATTFQNGFRPDWEHGKTRIRLFNSEGRLVRTNEVNVPQADSVRIRDVAVGKTGLVAAVGSALSKDGVEAGTLLLFDKPGAPYVVVRTNPFIPTAVVIAADGYVWVAGTDPKVEFWIRPPATAEEKAQLCVLQKYTANGALLGNVLKRSNFDPKILPWNCMLRSNPSGIGMFIYPGDTSGIGEWVELSPEGDITGRWPANAPQGLLRGKVALTDSGSVYSHWLGNPEDVR